MQVLYQLSYTPEGASTLSGVGVGIPRLVVMGLSEESCLTALRIDLSAAYFS